MKAKVIVAFLFSIVAASQPAFTAVPRKVHDDEPPHVAMVRVSADNAHVLAHIAEISPVIPRGPRDVLRDYELEMASIAERLSIDLGAISNAVATGQITREQGEYASGVIPGCNDAFSTLQRFAHNPGRRYRPNAVCAGACPVPQCRDGGRNAIFLSAAKSVIDRIPGIEPDPSQINPETDGPGATENRTLDA
jgi:hypothetical protein